MCRKLDFFPLSDPINHLTAPLDGAWPLGWAPLFYDIEEKFALNFLAH